MKESISGREKNVKFINYLQEKLPNDKDKR